MELTRTQQRNLDNLWGAFDDRNVEYVVLRGDENLPESITGNDVDMLVAADSFDDAIAYCKREFEPTESIPRNALHLALLVSRSPGDAIGQVLSSPIEALSAVKRHLVSTEVTVRQYVSRVFDADGLQLHLVNHLTYKSPMDGSRVRVDPTVERGMFDRRIKAGGHYVPAPPDKLTHLVCRGVFDYDGNFPPRYAIRCNELVEEIRSDPLQDEQFRDVLSHIFYGVDTLVYELVMSGDYDVIRTRLRRCSDY